MLVKRRLNALMFSVIGSILFLVLNFPLPFLLGPMVGCLVAALAGSEMQGMGSLGVYMRTFLGVAVGASITPELLSQLPQIALSLAFVPPFTLVIGLIGFWFFRRVGFDRVTSFYSAMPGGLQDMLVFGEEAGGNVRSMSLVHATRVLLIFALVPFIVTFFWNIDLSSPPGQPAAELPRHEIALMAATGFVGWQVAARLGIPGGSLLGPLLLAAALSLLGWINSRPPAEILLASQFFIGLGVGVKYVGVTGREVRHDVLAGLGYGVIVGMISLLFFVFIHYVLGSDALDTLLAFLPGGQAEMAIIAILAGSDVAFVVTHHVLRVFIVILFTQIFANWLRRK